MAWVLLVIAGCFEFGFMTCLGMAQRSKGTVATVWYGAFLVTLVASMLLLAKATQTLPLGTAYAVWTGIGVLGTALVGILVFDEPAHFWRLFFIATLGGSAIGLKLVSAT